jgi:hypothetical protein
MGEETHITPYTTALFPVTPWARWCHAAASRLLASPMVDTVAYIFGNALVLAFDGIRHKDLHLPQDQRSYPPCPRGLRP